MCRGRHIKRLVMLRYFFDVYQNDQSFPDFEGFLYASQEDAYKDAAKTLRDIMTDQTLTRIGVTLRDETRYPIAHMEAMLTARYL